jgi:tryptophan synthase alpha chain
MKRYHQMFERLANERAGAFVPFTVLGDPNPAESISVVEALLSGGADALELGIPFSDPVADGRVIQAAAGRALSAGASLDTCLNVLRQIRQRHAEIPLGVLTYGNLVMWAGAAEFFARLVEVGVDSVLIVDIPSVEFEPYAALALAAGLAPIMIVPPNATRQCIERVSRLGRGYTYVLGRAGVTGTESAMHRPAKSLIESLAQASAPPALIGFGISSPEHVRAAIDSGARGAICGSAIVKIVEENLADERSRREALSSFVSAMKAATRAEPAR